jgi:serine/threonine protein kinase
VGAVSAGCLVYYVLTGGLHPFGPSYEREVNIRKSQPTLHPSLSPEARDLVFAMIENNPTKRYAHSSLKHLLPPPVVLLTHTHNPQTDSTRDCAPPVLLVGQQEAALPQGRFGSAGD